MQVIKGTRNNFGLQIEPDTIIPDYDPYGTELYPSTLMVDTVDGWIAEENLEKYILKNSDKIDSGEVKFFDGERDLAEYYDTFEYLEEVFTLCTLDDFIEYLNFDYAEWGELNDY